MGPLILVLTLVLPTLPGAKPGTAATSTAKTTTTAETASDGGTAFDPAEISIPAGASTGRKAYIDVEGFKSEKLVGVTDRPSVGDDPVKVQFTNPQLVSTAQNIWSVDVAVEGMPAVTALTRRAQLTFSGKGTDTVTYVLTSKPKAFTWTVTTGPKELSYEPNQHLTINVVTTGGNGTNLRIATSSLQSAESGVAIEKDLLTLTPDGENTIRDGRPTQFDIAFDTEKIPAGSYTGTLNFAVDESPDLKGVELTFNTSSRGKRLLGLLAIFAGVVLSLLIGVVLRSIVTNAEAMMPAAKLGDIAVAHEETLRGCKVDAQAPDTLAMLQSIREHLSAPYLRKKGYLRPWLANPFGTTAASPEGLTAHLQEQSDHLTALGHLIENGFCVAATKTIDPKIPAHVAARQKLFEDLDLLSKVKKIDEVTPLVASALNTFDLAIGTAEEGMMEVAPVAPTMQQLLYRVTVVSAFGWLIVLIVTVITGYAILIANQRGFGSTYDLLLCFLWGLGVQTAGQQLSATTSSSIIGTLGFTNPSGSTT